MAQQGMAKQRNVISRRRDGDVPGMVKPSCLGVFVVSMAAGFAVVGRSATAAAFTEVDSDAQMALPAVQSCTRGR